MGKVITTKIDRFDGGMTNDIRSRDLTKARLIKNLDNSTYTHRLTPHRDSEAGDTLVTTDHHHFSGFEYAEDKLWGLGKVDGTAKPFILYKNDFTNATWSNTTFSEGAAASDETGLVYYKIGTTGYIFGFQADRIFKYATSGASFTDADLSVVHTASARGLVHSKDGRLYMPYDNNIAVCNTAGTWTAAALTINPPGTVITSITEYGNYLAIGVIEPQGSKSRVYLWDCDATTWSDNINWGSGLLYVLQEIEGVLVGVSEDTTNTFTDSIVIREYTGGSASVETLRLRTSDSTSTSIKKAKQRFGDRLYFLMSTAIDGTNHYGVWSVGRGTSGRFDNLRLDYTPNNDTAPSSLGEGFFITGDYCFIAYNDGTYYTTSKTNDSATYSSTTSIWESLSFDLGEASIHKKLLGITVNTTPLPAAGQVVLKYKADAESSWTTIFTNTTDDSITHSSVNIESTGANLPEFKEIRFRIESTGGAEITGITFDCEVMDKRPY